MEFKKTQKSNEILFCDQDKLSWGWCCDYSKLSHSLRQWHPTISAGLNPDCSTLNQLPANALGKAEKRIQVLRSLLHSWET